MDLAASIEVALLAAADAVHLPIRAVASRKATSNVNAARALYPSAGVEWRSGGRTMTERKDFELALKSLEAAGRVRVGRPRTKALYAKLSDVAELEARARVGLPGLYGTWLLMREVAAHSDRNAGTLDKLFVGEDVLSRHRWGHPDTAPFRLTEEMALPALLRRWLLALADSPGHVYYRLTAAGWAEVEGPAPKEPAVKIDRKASKVYVDRLRNALHLLDTAEPDNERAIGPLPLPVALRGVPVGPWVEREPRPAADNDEPEADAAQ